jgi:hypothetical protein
MSDQEMYVEHWWNDTDRENNEVVRKNPIPLQFCPLQIRKGPDRDRHRSSTMSG